MEREIIITRDGSSSIAIPQIKATYHSIHGALQESVHVFIKAGLCYKLEQHPPRPLHILEMGLGTGLNAFLTAIEADNRQFPIRYTALEPYPLTEQEAALLNYPELLGHGSLFEAIHHSPWEGEVSITGYFSLQKQRADLSGYNRPDRGFDLVYYDAFAPSAQPELWTENIFRKLYGFLLPGGIMVTYCSKAVVRRAMEAAGFRITKVQGPLGKKRNAPGDEIGTR